MIIIVIREERVDDFLCWQLLYSVLYSIYNNKIMVIIVWIYNIIRELVNFHEGEKLMC